MSPNRSRKRSIRSAYFAFIVLVVFVVIAMSSFVSGLFREFYVFQLENSLKEKGHLIAERVSPLLAVSDKSELVKVCNELGEIAAVRLSVIALDGTVLCDSSVEVAAIDNHGNRAEFREALAKGYGSSMRLSSSAKKEFLYVAVLLKRDEVASAVVRTAVPLDVIDTRLDALLSRIYTLEFFIALSLCGLSFILYRLVNAPLQRIREGAERFAQGQLHQKLPLSGIAEVDGITVSMNSMARRLSRLEEVRRDFVANVSHELKTPITLIKGFVETLLDGAMNSKDDLKRFLLILATQANRLNTIIEDLLTLARLESESEKDLMMIRPEPINELILSVVESCEAKAKDKQIEIAVDCPPSLVADLDRGLAEQALINFVDNAIKYSSARSRVNIRASLDEPNLVLSVSDEGPGIPAEHLPRLFERFYRVDKARSRDLGGTGLGLSIVKHIAEVHGGTVNAHSVMGSGSEFRIMFPQNLTSNRV